jgi:hypothetical protein
VDLYFLSPFAFDRQASQLNQNQRGENFAAAGPALRSSTTTRIPEREKN